MRLWHKDLIKYLPRQQLLGQWRECCWIAQRIHDNGTPSHMLVNKIMDYPIDHFLRYAVGIKEEMTRRGYKCDWEKFKQYFPLKSYRYYLMEDIFPDWHNNRYLRQCLYNLQEKRDCGGITEYDWEIIADKFSSKF